MPRQRFALALALSLVAGGALRLGLAERRPLWIDEIYRLAWAHGCRVSNFHDVTSATLCINQPPRRTRHVLRVIAGLEPAPNVLLLNRWMRLSGARSDLAIRLPLVIISVLGLVGVGLLGRELGGARLGLAAAALVAVSPLHVYYGAELNNYALACCLVIFSYLFYFRLLRHGPGLGDVLGYVLCTGAALLTHYYALIVFAAQVAAIPAAVGFAPRRLIRTSIPFLLVAAGFAAYLPVLLSQLPYMISMQSGEFGGIAWLGWWLRTVPLYPWLWEQAGLLGPIPATAGALCVTALVVTGLRAIPDARWRRVLAVNIFFPLGVVATAYLVRGSNQILWPRYGLFFTVPALLATAAVWARPGWRPGTWVAAGLAVALLVTGLLFLFRGAFHRDWRRAADIVALAGDPDEPVLVHNANLVFALGRYLPPDRRMYGVFDWPEVSQQVADDVAGRAGAWAVLAWDDDSPIRARLLDVLGCHFGSLREYALHKITLLHFRAKTGGPAACGPANQFAFADASCWAESGTDQLSVQGWIETPAPESINVLVNDAVAAQAAGPAPAPGAPAGAVAFTRQVDIRHVADGALFWVGVRARAPDGTDRVGRLSVPCIKRPRVAMQGTGETPLVLGFIESPAPRSRVPRGHRVAVTGWAFATEGIRELVFLVDGRECARSRQHGFGRPDVRAAHPELDPELTMRSAFVGGVDTAQLDPGPHVLTAAVVHPDGTQSPVGAAVEFEVAPAP